MDPTQLTRYDIADFARRAGEMCLNFIGGSCGVIASHLPEMAKVLGKYQEQTVWTLRPDAPMSETRFNWEGRQG